MQQPPTPPPDGPGAPYAESPYIAPPPTRTGPGFMMYCLGCMGVVAVIVIIGIVFMVTQVKKAMGPITAANVQSVLPPGVPIYPGFTLVEQQSRSVRLPSKGSATRAAFLSFRTGADMSAIGPWYKKQLVPQGWVGGASPTDPNSYQFKKGNTMITMQEKPSSGTRTCAISVVQGIAPKSP
jgi:hypothetical protein